MAPDASPSPAESPTALDDEIADLEAQAEALQKALKIQCSTVLASAPSPSAPSLARRSRLAVREAQQRAYMQQASYRTCAPVTAFKVRDPDPCAVDGGHVLGLRFEVMSRGQFLQPYYVMLNRPYSSSSDAGSSDARAARRRCLRVHRHTVPPAVPLAGIAARHLPPPRQADAADAEQPPPPRQDLDRFVRALRREIVRYHNRLGVAADLRRRLGLQDMSRVADPPAHVVVDVAIADIEAKQIKLTWADDRSGRLVMDDDGRVLKLVVFGAQGRDWETAKELFGNYDRIEDIARKLEEHHGAVPG